MLEVKTVITIILIILAIVADFYDNSQKIFREYNLPIPRGLKYLRGLWLTTVKKQYRLQSDEELKRKLKKVIIWGRIQYLSLLLILLINIIVPLIIGLIERLAK